MDAWAYKRAIHFLVSIYTRKTLDLTTPRIYPLTAGPDSHFRQFCCSNWCKQIYKHTDFFFFYLFKGLFPYIQLSEILDTVFVDTTLQRCLFTVQIVVVFQLVDREHKYPELGLMTVVVPHTFCSCLYCLRQVWEMTCVPLLICAHCSLSLLPYKLSMFCLYSFAL